MAYTRPMVMVFQEYADTSTTTPSASLPPCIIGPCYHIVDAVEDEGNALYGQYTEAGIESGFFPNNAPGALIDEKSVSFRLKNARVRLYSDLSASVLSTGNCLLFDGDSYPKGILVGDVVKLTDKTDPDAPAAIETEYRVTTVDDISKALFLNRTLPAGKTLTVEIQRIIEDITLPAGSEGILLDVTSERFTMIGVMTPIEGLEDAPKACRISAAELYIGYKALRQDLSDVLTLYSTDEIEGQLGKIVPENPLAFGVNIAMANAAIGIKCIGVDSDDLAGYTAAKDRLETHDPVYELLFCALVFKKANAVSQKCGNHRNIILVNQSLSSQLPHKICSPANPDFLSFLLPQFLQKFFWFPVRKADLIGRQMLRMRKYIGLQALVYPLFR